MTTRPDHPARPVRGSRIRPAGIAVACASVVLLVTGCVAGEPAPSGSATASSTSTGLPPTSSGSPTSPEASTPGAPPPADQTALPTPYPSSSGDAAAACALIAGPGDSRTEAAALGEQAAAEDPAWTDLAAALQTLSGKSFPTADADPADVNAYLDAYSALIPLCAPTGSPLPEG